MNIQAPPNLKPGRARRADRRRHQRLGRRVAGHARPRQPRGAVAGARRARARAPPPPANCWSSGWRSIRHMRSDPARWLDAGAAHRRCCARSTPRVSPAPTTGSPAPAPSRRASPSPRPSPARERGSGESPLAACGERVGGERVCPTSSTAPPPARRSTKPTSSGCSRRAATNSPRSARRRRSCAGRCQRRHGQLRRQPQHQLHQHLLFPLPVLRLLEGQAQRESARPALRPRPRRDRRGARGGLGARRHRSLPAGRHPPGIHRRDLSRDLPRDQAGGARHARPRLLAARSLAGRQDPRPHRCPISSPSCATPGSARCPAPRPKSSTTRCAR